MAEGDGFVYDIFKGDVMKGLLNLHSGGDTLKLMLVNGYTPNIKTHVNYASVSGSEYGAGLGYTVTGETVTGQTVTVDTANDRGVLDAADVTWTSLGTLSPAIPSDCILYDDTPTSPADPLIAYWELGVTSTNGGNYTIQWGANGIILLT